MKAGQQHLTDSFVRALKPKSTRYEVGERGGLKIRISPSGAKTWVYAYRHDDALHRLTLGTYPAMPLVKARAAATAARAAKHAGGHPALEAQATKQRRRQEPLLEEVAKEFLEKHSKRHKRSWAEDERIFNKDILPALGKLRARDIRRRDVITLLEDVAARAPGQANRALEVLRKMFNWAVEREIVESNPCWQVSRPSPKKSRDRVLSATEIATLWNVLDHDRSMEHLKLPLDWPSRAVRLGLKLALVTAQRRGEIAGASKAEFDLAAGWWVIDGSRAKNGRTHRVPLSDLAVEILTELFALSGDSPWLLPSPRGDGAINPNALSRATTRIRATLSIPHWTEHDLRRTAASHMASAGTQRLVIARILNHTDSSVTAVYDRHSYDAEKRVALARWAKELASITSSETPPSSARHALKSSKNSDADPPLVTNR